MGYNNVKNDEIGPMAIQLEIKVGLATHVLYFLQRLSNNIWFTVVSYIASTTYWTRLLFPTQSMLPENLPFSQVKLVKDMTTNGQRPSVNYA